MPAESYVQPALDQLTSWLKKAGIFKEVKTVEKKTTPVAGITAALYLAGIELVGKISGLGKGTGLYTFTLRLYSNVAQDPPDQIDPELAAVIDKVFNILCGDFELDGNVRNIDILGEVSEGLKARAGHVEVGGAMYRAIDISIPLIIDDVVEFTP